MTGERHIPTFYTADYQTEYEDGILGDRGIFEARLNSLRGWIVRRAERLEDEKHKDHPDRTQWEEQINGFRGDIQLILGLAEHIRPEYEKWLDEESVGSNQLEAWQEFCQQYNI